MHKPVTSKRSKFKVLELLIVKNLFQNLNLWNTIPNSYCKQIFVNINWEEKRQSGNRFLIYIYMFWRFTLPIKNLNKYCHVSLSKSTLLYIVSKPCTEWTCQLTASSTSKTFLTGWQWTLSTPEYVICQFEIQRLQTFSLSDSPVHNSNLNITKLLNNLQSKFFSMSKWYTVNDKNKFSYSGLWAGSVIESPCPCVCLS